MLYNLRNGIIASPHEINSHLLALLITCYTQNHAVTYTNQMSTHLLQLPKSCAASYILRTCIGM